MTTEYVNGVPVVKDDRTYVIWINDGGGALRYFTRVGEPPSKYRAEAFRFPSYEAASEYLSAAGRQSFGAVGVEEVPA